MRMPNAMYNATERGFCVHTQTLDVLSKKGYAMETPSAIRDYRLTNTLALRVIYLVSSMQLHFIEKKA